MPAQPQPIVLSIFGEHGGEQVARHEPRGDGGYGSGENAELFFETKIDPLRQQGTRR